MDWIGQVVLAFGSAALLSYFDFVSSNYPRTIFLLRKSWQIYLYAAFYGVMAALVFWLLPSLLEQIQLQGIGIGNPWVQALVLGLSIKALLHIRLYTVTLGAGRSFPLGIETLVNPLDRWLTREIDLFLFSARKAYLRPYIAKYPDLAVVKAKAAKEIPDGFAADEKVALTKDVGDAADVEVAMRIYLRYVGRRVFESVFPL
jgi:hypothetical protein